MNLTEAQQMLCLSALTYRRFDETVLPQLDAMRLNAAVRRGLADIAPLAHKWELAWGPSPRLGGRGRGHVWPRGRRPCPT